MGSFLKVDLYFKGTFIRNPVKYDGAMHHLFEAVDFAGMDVRECFEFLERFTDQRCAKLYYYLPWHSLAEGLKPMSSDLEYSDFIGVAYESGCHLSVYIDHVGVDVMDWILEDKEEVVGPDEMDICDGEEEEGCTDEEEGYEGSVMKMDKNSNDPFLSKLCCDDHSSRVGQKCTSGEHEMEAEDSEGGEDEADLIENPTRYNDSIDWKLQKPILAMRFESTKELKYMLCNYTVANGYQLTYKKNDSKRLLVVCSGGECPFRLWASWMSEERSFQIKSLIQTHNCARNFKMGSIVTYAWIGSHFTKDFLHKQKMSVRLLREEVKKMFGIDASMSQCRRAKQYALSLIDGTLVEHYAKLWSYAEEIRRSDPGSSVKLGVNCLENGNNYFSKFYVCFDGVKKGWLNGCRRIINLDGCFFNGICCGELLSAVGRDANNQIYPIAWAVVCVENKENWKWFLENLIEDLNLKEGGAVTLMSDQHKGLLKAVKELLPQAEHRKCARHIYANFRKNFSGAHWEKMFWKASKATTEQHFNAAMKEIQVLSQAAYQHLMDRNPKSWSRAFFLTDRGCDAVKNGISESFNNTILDARKKPIITMLEEIRIYVMERMFSLSLKGSNWQALKVCPNIRTIINELGISQRHWQVLPCGFNQFEVRDMTQAYTVDIEKKTCACRLWQLNGIGCVHSITTISYLNRPVDEFVDPLYLATFYKNTYKYPMFGMNGSNMWPVTNYIPPLPPVKRRMPGRPTFKRKRDMNERKGKHRVSKLGKRVLCSVCKQQGHNKLTCPQNQPPPPLPPTKIPAKKAKKNNASSSKTGLKEKGNKSKSTGKGDGETSGVGEKAPTTNVEEVGQKQACDADIIEEDQLDGAPPLTQTQPDSQPSGVGIVVSPRKRSERILKKKMGKMVGEKNGLGNIARRPLLLDESG